MTLTEYKMGFIGVSTASSAMMRIFPRWAELLNLPVRQLVGHDVPLGAGDQVYRDLIAAIRDDPAYLGALVTTHKIRVYEAAGDLFAGFDEFARLCGEVSSIAKDGGRLVGQAKDPVSAGLALEEFLPPGHFAATGAEALCLGAGGAGTAITWYLARRADHPTRLICTDTDPARLAHLRQVHRRGGLDVNLFRYEQIPPGTTADHLVTGVPPGSLVINATGLGKDRPGSPLSPAARFPENALVWELNYRGPLEFLREAEAQSAERGLTVVDGWRYFIHGWTQVIAAVFNREIDAATIDRLAAVAAELR